MSWRTAKMSHLDFALTGFVRRRAILAAAIVFGALPLATAAQAGDPITRGATIAIEEINAKGGVLGRPLELVRRDDEANPAKGLTAARELIQREKVAVLLGGLDTPVQLAIVPFVNNTKFPFMVPWAAGTNITQNGAPDNYVFRVSAMDEEVDRAIVAYSQKIYKAKKPGMILVNNPWGESNEVG